MSDLPKDHPQDGRKYHVGDHVEFTDDDGKKVPGVVHAVRYQQGRYELRGAHHEVPSDPTTPTIPGTGEMVLIPGTENERHSFEYIMVHEATHKAWWDVEKGNQAKIKKNEDNVKRLRGSVHKDEPDHPDNFAKLPPHEPLEAHPELKQHIRIYEPDEVDKAKAEG